MPEKLGRPSKLTKELQDAIVVTLKIGNYLDVTARVHGLNPSTVHSWIARGKRELRRIAQSEKQCGEVLLEMCGNADCVVEPFDTETIFVDFAEVTSRARAEAESDALLLIKHAAMQGDSKSAQWFLERAHSQRWGHKAQVALVGDADAPLNVEHSGNVRIVSYESVISQKDSDAIETAMAT